MLDIIYNYHTCACTAIIRRSPFTNIYKPEEMCSSRKKHKVGFPMKKFTSPSTNFTVPTVFADISCIGLKNTIKIDNDQYMKREEKSCINK